MSLEAPNSFRNDNMDIEKIYEMGAESIPGE
jgi:hypothetical protein